MELVVRYKLQPERVEQLIKDARAWEKSKGYKYGTDEAALLLDAMEDGAIEFDRQDAEIV